MFLLHFTSVSTFLIVPSPFHVCFYFRFVSPFFFFPLNSYQFLHLPRFSFYPVFFHVGFLACACHLSSQATSPRCSTELLHFPLPTKFNFIFWFIVLVFCSFSFGCYFPPFHTLVFLLSPCPAAACLPHSTTKLRFSTVLLFLFRTYLSTTYFTTFLFFPLLTLLIETVSFVSLF